MAVDDPLDFTPSPTLNTWQTSSESANILINALLFVLILTNIGSALSKLVYASLPNRILYAPWLRAYIFAHSDDPLRILAWTMRRYAYRDPAHARAPNRLRLRRLLLPLLARSLIVVMSVISVAVNIPTETVLDGCENGDYAVVFDPVNANPNLPRQSICAEIPLVSRFGSPDADAVSCVCPVMLKSSVGSVLGASFVAVAIDPNEQTMLIAVGSLPRSDMFSFYMEWRTAGVSGNVFRSRISDSVSMQMLSEAVEGWFLEDHPECNASPPDDAIVQNISLSVSRLDCTILDTSSDIARIESRLRDSISFERRPEIQERIALPEVSGDGATRNGTSVSSCMVPITVTFPIANMGPLLIILLVWIVINTTISAITRRYDNVLDVAFGLVSSALGRDATLNPLEECTDRNSRRGFKLLNWKCGAGGFHRGFLCRDGDDAVKTLDEGAVMGSCAVARIQFEKAKEKRVSPAGSSDSLSFSKWK